MCLLFGICTIIITVMIEMFFVFLSQVSCNILMVRSWNSCSRLQEDPERCSSTVWWALQECSGFKTQQHLWRFLSPQSFWHILRIKSKSNRTLITQGHVIIYLFIYLYIQWGKKVFSQPPIVQVLPLKKMREACNFHHRYTSTMRDKIRKKIQKITL